jgi:phosphoenolpyruvate carboxykinase (ATP)
MTRLEEIKTLGINPKGEVHFNLTPEQLHKRAVELNEGVETATGALLIETGKYTGRSPKDRFIVAEDSNRDNIDWGSVNVAIAPENFTRLYNKITAYLSSRKELFVFDGCAGADEKYHLNIRVINELVSQNLFVHQMLRRLDKATLEKFMPEFTLLAAPGCKADPQQDGTNSEAFVIISFAKKVIIIGGTGYCGEIKKSIFSVANYVFPRQNILTMHCSANSNDKNDAALFFGLSGTGKTTLSADPNRYLIGDDEHGWTDKGIFNIEGGCYAKCINLSRTKEPEIYAAIKFGAVVENVVMDAKTKELDFHDSALTENTRAAYPLNFINNSVTDGLGAIPKTIIFLTADAFGVLPPIAKLTVEQAMYHFMSGYTAKVAGTERGIIEPQATFSAFFGAPFMPLKPMIYADLLAQKIKAGNTNVFFINTGWTGGKYGVGQRMDLSYTRAIVTAALNGALNKVAYHQDPIFNLAVPEICPDVPPEILDPKQTWSDAAAYNETAKELANLFQQNFTKNFTDKYAIPKEIVQAGPRDDGFS